MAGGSRQFVFVSREGCADGPWLGGEMHLDHTGGNLMCRSQAPGDLVLCSGTGLANGASCCVPSAGLGAGIQQ